MRTSYNAYVEISSNKQLKQFYAQRLQGLSESAQPRCPYFGECGGCALQHLAYADQLRLKQEAVGLIMAGIFGQNGEVLGEDAEQSVKETRVKSNAESIPITGSVSEYEYRFRMDYVTCFEPFHTPNNRMGLRKRKQFNYVLDLSECHLVPNSWFQKLRAVYEYILSEGLSLYDLVKNTGELRYFVVRIFQDQAMLNIVTRSAEKKELVEKGAAHALVQGFTSVHWLVQPSVTDLSSGELVQTFGKPGIEVLLSVPDVGEGLTSVAKPKQIKLQVGPNNFFQNNVPTFELLLDFVAQTVRQHGAGKVLYDLYGGIGTFGLALADQFAQVICVELEPANVEAARLNAQTNKVSNIECFQGDIRSLVSTPGFKKYQNAVAIVDPPRAGLEVRGVSEILTLKPDLLVYVSCNPITQQQDLEILLKYYELLEMHAFDMFPQTLHVENVAVLKLN